MTTTANSAWGPDMRQEYLIECRDDLNGKNRWFIAGSERLEHVARSYFRDYVKSNPEAAWRVTECPSRRVVIQSTPINKAA